MNCDSDIPVVLGTILLLLLFTVDIIFITILDINFMVDINNLLVVGARLAGVVDVIGGHGPEVYGPDPDPTGRAVTSTLSPSTRRPVSTPPLASARLAVGS